MKNGYFKKKAYILILEALFGNPNVNFEHHLHLIVEICLGFMIVEELSDKESEEELIFRVHAGDFLSRLLNW